uniref:C2H2-type domain-containing protein n=1 Tax=Bubo bubo TaxID=30461 RepID=A0A8C0F624_BUBBB
MEEEEVEGWSRSNYGGVGGMKMSTSKERTHGHRHTDHGHLYNFPISLYNCEPWAGYRQEPLGGTHVGGRSWRTVSRGREPTAEQGRSVRSPPAEGEAGREGLGGAQVPSGIKAQHGANGQGHAGCEKEEKGREGADPQLSPFGLPTGAGTDKQKEEQCQPREEQRGMLQGPEEEPQSPTVDVEHDGQRQPDDTQKEYRCGPCGKVFTCVRYLKRHRRIHAGEKPYKCQDCGKRFRRRCHVLCHQTTHTKEKPFACTMCGKRFSFKANLITHRHIHTGERKHTCSDCGKSFWRKSHLLRHQESFHNGESSVEASSCISLCSAIKCREGGLGAERSWRTVSRGREPTPEQGRSVRSPPPEEEGAREGLFGAQVPSGLKAQHGSNSREKEYKCEQCGKVFTWRSNLSHHRQIHTGVGPYKCRDCGKKLWDSWKLVCRRRTHIKKPFVCTICGKCFSFISHLSRHQLIHTGDRPYTCSDCGKSFRQHCHLLRHHLAIHNCESSGGGIGRNPISHRVFLFSSSFPFPGSPPAGGSSQQPNPAPS